ncbi:MAG: SDR family oxidoreductase [Deltaproteobacteria bacterium]|nr:SDR family oxidoreductase [Deltaproteobacteria bacterium]MBW1944663.1 SDR family oxidoreductase [Deltaproteobacteria bacterium]MBW2206482.1 SDR family oxidoreductase [Deltaproteobacteria bacterium]
MMNKKVLITGATDGIGRQTALDLAGMGAHVLIHGRDPKRLKAAAQEIKRSEASVKVEIFVGDFSSLDQVRQLARDIKGKHDRLDVLINNAGILDNRQRTSEDGYEMTFAVNHLATFLLTGLLLELLKKSAPSRIVNVTSMMHSHSIDFENLQGERGYDGHEAYGLSKLCNVLFTYELAERLKGTGVTVNCLHPGVINTKLFRGGWGGGGGGGSHRSENLLYVATDKALADVTGKYFMNIRETRSADITYEPVIREKLWRMSEEMTGIQYK